VNCGWSQREGTLQTGSLLHVEVCDDASALLRQLCLQLISQLKPENANDLINAGLCFADPAYHQNCLREHKS
jgi:hypothetical protein